MTIFKFLNLFFSQFFRVFLCIFQWFLILLNFGWMVDLAMIIFEFLTKFMIIWHPWHLDLRPQWFKTDWCNSSPSAMRDQYFCFLAKFGCTRINLALSTDQNIVLCCDLLTDDKFWEDFFGIWISYLNSTLVGRCTFFSISKQLVCTSKCFSFDLQFLPTS